MMGTSLLLMASSAHAQEAAAHGAAENAIERVDEAVEHGAENAAAAGAAEQNFQEAEATHTEVGHVGHETHGVPWASIGVQAFNFGLLLVFLGWILRKTIAAHFAHRARDYRQLVERAETARRAAEQGHREIKERLDKLEAGAAESLVRAKAEAEELKGRMIADAKGFSQKLEQEAQRSVQVELEKAKAELRRELLQQALKTSGENLKSKLGSSEQKKLQSEFVDKMQVVGG